MNSNGIDRIQKQFSDGKVNIAYLTAGDGGIQRTLDAALALIAGGVNMLEIGVPFSDPIADGPVIQAAAARAIAANTTLADILWLTSNIRQYSDVPLILFSYLNPILSALSTSSALSAHKSSFLLAAKRAGIDGLLIVDSPFEENLKLHDACLAAEIAPIYVIAESTSLVRLQEINARAHSFLYFACQRGITGIRQSLPENLSTQITFIKSHVRLPIVVGFGISRAEQVKQVLQYADGVVIGSLFVKSLAEGMSYKNLTSLAKNIFSISKSNINIVNESTS